MNDCTRKDIRENIEPLIREMYRIDKLIEIGGYQNFVYEGVLKEKKVVFRLTEGTRRSESELKGEIAFMNTMYEGGVSLCRPEDSVHRLEGKEVHYHLCVFEKIEGYDWREIQQNDEHIRNAGRALGKMHRIESENNIQYERATWRENGYFKDVEKYIEDSELIHKMKELIRCLESLSKDKKGYGLIHGDYLYCNMIYGEEEVTIIDFDECEYNWFVYDIAVYLFYNLLGGDPKNMDIDINKELFKVFISGYKEEYKLDEFWLKNINHFFRLREFVLLSSIYRSAQTVDLGKWQRGFIETTEHRIKNDIPFVDIDFKEIYDKC